MPKLKSHKASLKRFKVTATGKVLAYPTGARHNMSGKSSKKRRHLRRARPLKSMDRKRMMKAQHVSQLPKMPPAAPKTPASTPEGA
jgi:large subunit ribosomal protein L35